jgi:hypothetical protein
MNVGLTCGDEPAAVLANRARLAASLPAPPRWMRLVHGATVVAADTVTPTTPADAAYTIHAGVVCCVTIADCLPVLLADPQGRVVGVAHAGWRGLAAGVVQNTVQAMRAALGEPHAVLHAWLGPAIGSEAFVVGADVRAALCAALPDAAAAFAAHEGTKFRADLFGLCKMALARVGVTGVAGGGVSTAADPQRFYSHRRDRITGRHAALIWRAADADPPPAAVGRD